MNIRELYNIALDTLAEKKSNRFGFSIDDKATITILVTEDHEIFEASNGSIIEDGKLQNTCSEQEAITLMLKSNKNRIDYIVSLRMEDGAFIIPCDRCLDLILQVNNENSKCKIMIDDNKVVELHTLLSNITTSDSCDDNNDFDDWLDGWDDDPTSNENTISTNTNTYSSIDSTPVSSKSSLDSLPVFEDNPIPNQPTHSAVEYTSSYYQSKYLNATPNPTSSYTVSSSDNITTFKKKNESISKQMLQNGLSESDKKDFKKQRLYNAFTVENVININGIQSSSTTKEAAEKQTLSKKELIRLAKEKKRMAKKDAKILETTNKRK